MSHAEQLDAHGLERLTLQPMRFPRVVCEGDGRLYIRCQVDGVDREVEVGQRAALALAEDLVREARLMARG